MTVKLKIENGDELLRIVYELKKAGLLTGVDIHELRIDHGAFPIEVPMNVDGLLKMLQNPMVKPFRKSIDQVFTANVRNLQHSLA